MNNAKDLKTVRIALMVVPETAPAVLYTLQELFASVGKVWENMTGKPAGHVRIAPELVAAQQDILQCAMRALIRPDTVISNGVRYDAVIATDLLFDADFDPRGKWQRETAWLKSQHQQGALIASVCTGSLLIAESGLLDGHEATTHWGIAPLFRNCYPTVNLTPEKVLVNAGEAHRVITSGGASSWTELALYLVAHYCGHEEASRTAKVFLLGDRNEGQQPFASLASPCGVDDAAIDACLTWIAQNYDRANPVCRMAEFSGLTERTFKRRFKTATGFTPIEYVQTLRIEEAKHLLETTGIATEQICNEVGYDDPVSFRRVFKRKTGVTPGRYRQKFNFRHLSAH